MSPFSAFQCGAFSEFNNNNKEQSLVVPVKMLLLVKAISDPFPETDSERLVATLTLVQLRECCQMFSAFPNQKGYSVCPSKGKCVCFGKPVNREFVQIRECEKGDRVLVLGGGLVGRWGA